MDLTKLKPSYCVWELTLACNQRCGHCGSKAGTARPDELTTSECLQTVKALSDLGCEVITLSGGEPTLRDDWFEIAREIRKQGMIPNMVSNGYKLDETLALRMKEAGLANVAISIDGPEDVHEQIRGRGSFARSCNSIKILRNAGMPVTIMTTINTLNKNRLTEIYDLACELGVERWRCQLGKSMGHMKANTELLIKPKDLLLVMPKLYELNERGPVKVGIGDSIGYFGPYDSVLRAISWKGTPQQWSGCQAGLYAIGIESNGGIKGCLSMQAFRGENDIFLEGNIRERSLESIWKDPHAFSYNRQFSVDNLTGSCKKCAHGAACRGGARCVSAASQQKLTENQFCYHRVANMTVNWPNVLRQARTVASIACLVGVISCDPVDPPQTCDTVKCDDPNLSVEMRELCCPAPEYGVEPTCEEVCCECDYGIIPQDLYEECCMPDPLDCNQVSCEDTTLPDGTREQCCPAPDYGVEPTCEQVCCDCDYGIIPPDLFQECCSSKPEK